MQCLIRFMLIILLCIISSVHCQIRRQLCQSWCIAKCLSTSEQPDESGCQLGCAKSASNCERTDVDCRCGQPIKDVPKTLPRIEMTNFTLNYVGELREYMDEPDPYQIIASWDTLPGVELYVLKFNEANITKVITRRDDYNSTMMTAIFNKTTLCSPVGLRIWYITTKGISSPSQRINRTSAPLKLGKQKINLESFQVVNQFVIMKFNYGLPPGWKRQDIRKINLESPSSEEILANVTFNSTSNQFTLRLSEEYLIQKSTTTLVYMFVKSMENVCGNSAFGDILNGYSIEPDCIYKWKIYKDYPQFRNNCVMDDYTCGNIQFNKLYDYTSGNSTDCVPLGVQYNVSVEWTFYFPMNYSNSPAKWMYELLEWTGGPGDTLQPEFITSVKREFVNTSETSLDLEPGKRYYFQACAVYNTDLNLQDFNVTLTDGINKIESTLCDADDSSPVLLPVYSIVIAICVVAVVIGLVVLFVCWWAKRKQKVTTKIKSDLADFMERYTKFPQKPVTDKWELDRKHLDIFPGEVLGRGAFGKVFKGQIRGNVVTLMPRHDLIEIDQELSENPIVAVKQCYESADEVAKREFFQEISLMKKLYYHPRVVNVIQAITKSEPLSLIVEYCPMGDLLHYLRERREYMSQLDEMMIDYRNPQPLDDIDYKLILGLRDVMLMQFQIADGMEYIGQKGYVHRDLAARNILVRSKNSLKIGDFGLCRYVFNDSAYLARGGKLPIKWMSLESLERFEFTTKSDVWSFGIVMFEIFTVGGTPYPDIFPQATDFRQAMLNILRTGERMEKPDNCPANMYDIMQKCWEANVETRPSFTSLKATLRSVVETLSAEESDVYYGLYIDPDRAYYNLELEDSTTNADASMNTDHAEQNLYSPSPRNSNVGSGFTFNQQQQGNNNNNINKTNNSSNSNYHEPGNGAIEVISMQTFNNNLPETSRGYRPPIQRPGTPNSPSSSSNSRTGSPSLSSRVSPPPPLSPSLTGVPPSPLASVTSPNVIPSPLSMTGKNEKPSYVNISTGSGAVGMSSYGSPTKDLFSPSNIADNVSHTSTSQSEAAPNAVNNSSAQYLNTNHIRLVTPSPTNQPSNSSISRDNLNDLYVNTDESGQSSFKYANISVISPPRSVNSERVSDTHVPPPHKLPSPRHSPNFIRNKNTRTSNDQRHSNSVNSTPSDAQPVGYGSPSLYANLTDTQLHTSSLQVPKESSTTENHINYSNLSTSNPRSPSSKMTWNNLRIDKPPPIALGISDDNYCDNDLIPLASQFNTTSSTATLLSNEDNQDSSNNNNNNNDYNYEKGIDNYNYLSTSTTPPPLPDYSTKPVKQSSPIAGGVRHSSRNSLNSPTSDRASVSPTSPRSPKNYSNMRNNTLLNTPLPLLSPKRSFPINETPSEGDKYENLLMKDDHITSTTSPLSPEQQTSRL